MLYEQWRAIAKERRGEIAVSEAASGRRWTFAELQAAGGAVEVGKGDIIFPRASFPEFLFDVLGAWREGKVVCPLEPGQAVPTVATPPSPIVHLKLTSATTSAARLVAFTAEQLAADVENIVTTMGLRTEWPNLGVISMPHSYGFSNLVLPLFLRGIPLIHVSHPLPEMVRRAAEGEAALTLAGVPALWRAWHEAGTIPGNVKLGISAGAPLPVKVEQEIFNSCGVKVHNFYGATECGGIAYDASATARTDDASVGQAMKNVELEVGTDGCLVVRSKAVGARYWPEGAEVLDGGRFQTSDLAELKDGSVYLRGRLSDLINVAGRKISPETIERALRLHPQVKDCLVFGAPSADMDRTDVIVAVVAGKVEEKELKLFLQQSIPAWQVPREWRFVEALTVNGRGKISRAEWRIKFAEKA